MKNIGIFCDGTWQHIDQPFPTNVALLAQAASPTATADDEKLPQVVYYDDGVGVSEGVLAHATHIVGGAFGKGLDYKVAKAYEFLALNYEPADRVFIFGFSRGAYTARCLGGLIRWLGILRRSEASRALDAMAMYRTRPPKPAGEAEQAIAWQAFEDHTRPFREAHSHHSDPFTGRQPYVPGKPSSLTPEGDCTWMQYIGVFDTVGSLGIPGNLPFADVINGKYEFYDATLSAAIRSARHAVSIDERRNTFQPTLWDNIAPLNTNAAANHLAYDQRPYQQRWFPGGHGAVGGGGQDGGISLPPLLWIAEGAVRAGFAFEAPQMAAFAAAANPAAEFQKRGLDLGEFVIEIDGMADRTGPQIFDEVSLSARLRHTGLTGYAPPPLRAAAVWAGLCNFVPGADPQPFYAP